MSSILVKYVLCPGTLFHENGQVSAISEGDLINLYGVNPNECVPKYYGLSTLNLIHLRPRIDGLYRKDGEPNELRGT